MTNLIPKKPIFALSVLMVIALLVFLYSYISGIKPNQNKLEEEKIVIQTNPSESVLLIPGEQFIFTALIGSSINPDEISVVVSQSSPSNPQEEELIVPAILVEEQKLRASIPTILPVTLYKVVLKHKNEVILEKTYLSKSLKPTPVANNDTALARLLPYEELSFLLEFNVEKNVYIMHFRYDPDSQIDIERQFEIAKENTNSFINRAGISLDDIVIEYLYK